MDKVRVLRWEHWDEDLWTADTTVDAYNVQQHDYRDGSTKYEASCGNEWPRDIGAFDTPDEAITACETDYIARCSEFLRVAGPGECVVNAQYLRSLVDATCKDTCQAYESTQECETCWVELLRRDATATIGATGGGK